MTQIINFFWILYFGLVPFDNLKDVSGATITKILGLVLIALLLINFLLAKRKTIKINFLNLFLLLIFIIYSFTYFVITKEYNVNYVRFCFLFVLFFLSSQYDMQEKSLDRVYFFSTLILSFIALSSIILNVGLPHIDRTHYYILGKMSVDANVYCSAMIFPALFLLNAILCNSERKKLILLLLLSPITISVLLCGSRGGIIAVVTGVIVLVFLNFRESKSVKKWIYLMALLLFVYIVIPYLPREIVNRLSLEAVISDKASYRFEIWKYAIQKYMSSGVIFQLFGRGFLSFRNVIGLNAVSHNLILQTLIEGGVLMMLLIIGLFVKLIKYLRNHQQYLMLSYIIALLAMSFSLDVIVSRFLWNAFGLVNFSIYINSKTKNGVRND
jgi:hypothetical protein